MSSGDSGNDSQFRVIAQEQCGTGRVDMRDVRRTTRNRATRVMPGDRGCLPERRSSLVETSRSVTLYPWTSAHFRSDRANSIENSSNLSGFDPQSNPRLSYSGVCAVLLGVGHWWNHLGVSGFSRIHLDGGRALGAGAYRWRRAQLRGRAGPVAAGPCMRRGLVQDDAPASRLQARRVHQVPRGHPRRGGHPSHRHLQDDSLCADA